MIYDFHAHLGTTSSGQPGNIEDLISSMDTYGIEKVGVSSLSGHSTLIQNNLVVGAMAKFPARVYGYAFINPKDPSCVEEVDRCLGDYKMKGVKFHSWKHGYYPDNTLLLDGIIDRVQYYGGHIQTHVGTSPLSTPHAWAFIAARHPKTPFIFTHLGYQDQGWACLECAKRVPNLSFELSGQYEVSVLERAFKELQPERLFWGTDWPYKLVHVEMEKLAYFGLSSSQLEMFLYGNAARIWGE